MPRAKKSTIAKKTEAGIELQEATVLPQSVSRYVLVGDLTEIDRFCIAKWGEKPEKLPDVRVVSRPQDVENIRIEPEFSGAAFIFVPGWARVEGLVNANLIYIMSEYDRRIRG